jgi:hypothetical protein
LIAVLTFSALMTTALAHDPPMSFTTFAYISVAPTTVGVNQEVLVYMWLQVVPPTASGGYGDRWHGYTLDVTKPDGTTFTQGPYDSDPIGFSWALFTPDQVGTYKLQFEFPGQTIAGENLDPNDSTGQEYIGDYYEPSISEEITLTVQQDQIPTYPDTPLPSDSWNRPIDAQHRDWYTISGNWLNAPGRNYAPANGYVPYSQAPSTSHILWAKELTFGGLVGGEFGANSFHGGNAYEGKWLPPVIIAGRLYYNEYPDDIYANRPGSYPRDALRPGVHSVDLRTGEEIWFNEEFRLDFGQVYMYNSPNQHGAFAYLWEVQGSTWNCYDAFNGDWVYTIENVPGGTRATAPDGSIYHYQLDTAEDKLTVWSNTAIPELLGGPTGTSNWQWRPLGKTVDGSDGYILDVPIPADIAGGINALFVGDRIIGTSGLGSTGRQYIGTEDYSIWSISLKAGEEGNLLWKKDMTGDGVTTMEFGDANKDAGVFTLWSAQTRTHWGFSIETGEQIWGPTESQAAWDMTVGTTKYIADGKLLSVGYAGILYCYDAQTGNLEWTYKVECPYYLESKWGSNYIIDHMLIADGKVFLFCGEHSPDDPKERGSPIACVDLSNGQELWKIPFYCGHWSKNPAIAVGILLFLSTYDNRIYAFGKGITETTVNAPQAGATKGSSVMITGTVTDQSAGAEGSPAISDNSMDEWMQYLYMQFPKPENGQGVQVKLTAVDENGNAIPIGTTTSDESGNYGLKWMPETEGTYTIKAEFEGSGAYYSSSDTTYMVVDSAVNNDGTTSTAEESGFVLPSEVMYGLIIAVIAIAIIVAVIVLKRK